jgi:hypothetical protein
MQLKRTTQHTRASAGLYRSATTHSPARADESRPRMTVHAVQTASGHDEPVGSQSERVDRAEPRDGSTVLKART